MDRQRAEDPTTSSSRILPTVQISDEAAASSASSSSSSAASVVPTSSSTSTRVSVVPPALANFVVPPPLATISNLPSPLNLERRSLSAMASLSSSPGRWLAYRDERTSSSSSDSGVVVCLSPPAPSPCFLGSSVSSLAALSPPGLSPLNVNDSPFSTPTPSSTTTRSRFTFDHVPVVCSTHTYQHRAAVQSASVSFPVVGHSPSETEEEEKDDVMESERSAFELPDRRRSESLDQVLQGVRKGSSSIGGAVRQHQRLGRKPSVIQSASKTSESKDTSSTVSLNSQLTVKVSESSLNSILQSQLLMSQLYPSRQHLLLTSSLSSPLHATNSHARLTSSASTASFMLSPTSLAVGGGDPSPRSNASSELLSEDDPGKQQYLCHICKKDFKRPDILSRHVRRHTGEKPFGCESCGRFFSRSDHLRTHRRTHTDEKPYHCSICSYSARRRDVLTRHMSTRHQAKAGISIFQRHRDVRRCLSDGAALAAMPRGSRKRLTTTCSKSRRVDSAATDTTTNDEDGEVMPKMEDIEDDVIVDDNSGCSQNIGN